MVGTGHGIWQNGRLYPSGRCRLRIAGPDAYTELPAPRAIRARSCRAHHVPGVTTTVAVKIRLKRMGKKFYAFYRVVVVDSRKKRDGKVIEEIGTYNPNTQPSTIQIKSDRAQYWLGVGAQPSEPVFKLLNITGDWQKYKGLEGAEGTLKTVEAGPDAEARIAAVEDQAQKLKAAKSEAAAKAKAEAEAAAAAEEAPAEEAAEEAPAEA